MFLNPAPPHPPFAACLRHPFLLGYVSGLEARIAVRLAHRNRTHGQAGIGAPLGSRPSFSASRGTASWAPPPSPALEVGGSGPEHPGGPRQNNPRNQEQEESSAEKSVRVSPGARLLSGEEDGGCMDRAVSCFPALNNGHLLGVQRHSTLSIHHGHTNKVTIIFFSLVLETEVTFFFF